MRAIFHNTIVGPWRQFLVVALLLLAPGALWSQCGSTVPGTSGNPFPLTIGTEAQCSANSLAVPSPSAQQQSNATPLACGATQQRDVWFVFTATANTTVISLYDVALADMGFIVYDAPCAANLNLVGCAGYEYPAAYTIIRGAFTTVPGNQYFVRVSRKGSNSFEGGLFGPSNNMRLCGWSWRRPPDEPTCEASFESGDTNGWTCRSGFYDFTWNFPTAGCLNPGNVDAPLDAGNGIDQGISGGNRHTVMSDKLYLDPRTNFNVSAVAPGGGNYSFRLGNNSWGCGAPESGGGIFTPPTCPSQAESIQIPLNVTVDNAGFTYMFAAVMLNPQHEAAEQPRFETLVLTPDGQTVSCGYFLFVAGSGLAQFKNGPDSWQYTDWTQVGLDLTDYIGQVVTIEFRVAGCYPAGAFGGNSAGQHSAYVYVDAFCQSFELESPTFCAGEASIEICAPDGFVNYSWPAGQPGVQGPLNQQCVTVLNPIAGTEYTVNMELITGCPTSTTIVLSGTPVTLTDDVTICAGQSVDLLVSVNDPDDEPYTFEWSNGLSGAGPHPVSPTVTTTYTVITTGASGCGSAAEVTVEVEFCAHVVTVEGGETCPGGCVDLEATLTNDLFPPYTYIWTGGIPNGPGPHSVCPTETTTYTVEVTDDNGSVATVEVVVEVLPLPELTFEVTDVSCNGGSNGALSVTATAATAPYTHVWATAPEQTGATATGLAVGSYSVTTTDANGCASTDQAVVEEPEVLAIAMASTAANCGEADGSATATVSGGAAPYTYAWETSPVQTTAIASDVVSGPLDVIATDANGCTITGSTLVPSIGGAELSSSFTDASCNDSADGTATVVATNGTEPYGYSWNTVPVQTTATAAGLAAGTYMATVTEGNGCIGYVEAVVPEPTAIVPVLTTVPGTCGYPNGTASVSASGGVGPYTWVWDTDPAQSDVIATGLLAGDVTVTVTDATGCTTDATILVVNVPGPVAGFTAEDVCIGSAAIFQNTSQNGVAWAWDMGDGTLLTQQNVQHSYTLVGTYTVVLTVTDISGCVDTFSSAVVVNAIPVPDFVGAPIQGCAPLSTSFENTSASPALTCFWQFGDGASSTDCAAPTHTYTQAGCFDVSLTITVAGCSSTLTVPQMVCADPVPVPSFSITPNPALTTEPFVVFEDLSIGGTSLSWTFAGGEPGTSDASRVVVDYSAQEPGTYEVCLVVTNDEGCVDSLCRTLILRDELRAYVPNSFTPDGDGINEVFIPVVVGHDPANYLLSIFNRWGEEIFQSDDPVKGWDGTVAGSIAQDGVYAWRLRVKALIGAEVREFKGHVTILR